MGHAHAVGLHGVPLAVVEVAHIRVVEVRDLLLARHRSKTFAAPSRTRRNSVDAGENKIGQVVRDVAGKARGGEDVRGSRSASLAGGKRSCRQTSVTCAARRGARPAGSATRSRRDRLQETGSISPLAHRGREGSRRTGIGGSIGRIGSDGTYLSPDDPENVPVMETNKTGGRVRAARASCAARGPACLPSTNLARSFVSPSFAPTPRPKRGVSRLTAFRAPSKTRSKGESAFLNLDDTFLASGTAVDRKAKLQRLLGETAFG